MSMMLTIEIPALDRLCGILEDRNRGNILAEIEQEIVKQLETAARGHKNEGTTSPAPKGEGKEETASEPRKPAQEPPKPKATEKPTEAAAPAPDAKPVTLANVQKAAAQMRDDGKLDAVKALFPEFGIRKLSDLKGDALQKFGDRLREMGAAI